jgi:hypothetical protein
MSLKCDLGTKAKFHPHFARNFDLREVKGTIIGIERDGDEKGPQSKRRISIEPNDFFPSGKEMIVSVINLKQLPA